MTAFFGSRKGIIVAGAMIGLVAAVLQKPVLQKLGVENGNPPNMGVCVACFSRDIAGAAGLHRAEVVQYIRPEIIGFVLGALIAALACGEWRPRGGSAPIMRFLLGVFAMIGALVFLGCPWRALLRLGAGDANAIVGLAGLAAGIALGARFLKSGYSLGRSHPAPAAAGLVLPLLMLLFLGLVAFETSFKEGQAIFFSAKGPGSMHAPLLISLAAGLLVGALAQRSRFCTMGAIRDLVLIRDTHLLGGAIALVVAAAAVNLACGQFKTGFAGMPISHANHLWNFLGMILAGLAFCLAGGCPGRQCFLAGEGDGDAAVFVCGMVVGAGLAHNWFLAAAPDAVANGAVQAIGGPGPYGKIAVVAGIAFCVLAGLLARPRPAAAARTSW